MIKPRKISIISTEQNYKWISMQEVLPAISKCWADASEQLKIEAKIFNVDVTPIRQFANFLLQSDLIVLIAFNETIAKVMRHIRIDLGIDAPFILHLYGHGSLGLWPQARFGALDVMNEGDTFIGTCPGDLACMKITSPNAKVLDIPYPFFPIEAVESSNAELVFAYIGRLSDQKNVDLLVESYNVLYLKNKNIPRLFIYGKEDFLGSPNMGIPSGECLISIISLIDKYKLQDKIMMKGFLPREEIYKEIGPHHVFVSTSTHSDENFGMALMRSLSLGARAVVTDWGGHKVFKKYAPDAVKVCPVIFKNSKPVIDPMTFSILMEESFLENTLTDKRLLPKYFHAESVVDEFKKIILNYKPSQAPIVLSEAAIKLHQQQRSFEALGFSQKAFHSYEDPLAQLFLKAYAE